MDQGTLSTISAIGGIVAAVGGTFAALAAWRSAGLAKNAADRAQEVERRSLLREVTATAQSVIAESLRVDHLANELKSKYGDLFILAGQTGVSRKRVLVDKIEETRKGVVPLQQEAKASLGKSETLRTMPEEGLSQLLTKFEGNLIQIRQVKEKFGLELVSVEQQIQPFREKP